MTYREWLMGFRDHYVAWLSEQDEEVTGFLCHFLDDFYPSSADVAALRSQISLDTEGFRRTLRPYLVARGWSRLDYLNHLIELENAK